MILLDTHVWIWWAIGKRRALSRAAAEAIESAASVRVSAWSCWEVATLVRHGKIALDRPTARWIADSQARGPLEVLPVDQRAAVAAGELPDEFPGDPADRAIYATAVTRALPLVTRDRRIRAFDPARTIW